jgi:hypothetical protein
MALLPLSIVQAILELAALILIFVEYGMEHKPPNSENPFNDGTASLPGIMLWLAAPVLGGRLMKSCYDIYKASKKGGESGPVEENEAMKAGRNGASTLLLAGSGIILGCLFSQHSRINADHIVAMWIYFGIVVACRATDLMMDFRGDGMFKKLIYPIRVEKGSDMRLYKAIGVIILLGAALVGLLFAAADNDSNNGATGGNELFWACFILIILHAVLAALVGIAVITKKGNNKFKLEVIALNESPLARSVVAGSVLFMVSLDFGHLWENAEPTFVTLSLVALIMADGLGRNAA